MTPSDYFYYRRMPHWQPPGAIFFVTFRTAGSLPLKVEQHYHEQAQLLKKSLKNIPGDAPELVAAWKKLFQYIDYHLEEHNLACHLTGRTEARIVAESIWKGQELGHYILHRYCVMPNHVHLLIEPLPVNAALTRLAAQWPPTFYTDSGRATLAGDLAVDELKWRKLSGILGTMKSSISRKIGKRLHLGEPLWRDESYDHWLRNGQEYENAIRYIDLNPVKARLCQHPDEWEFGSLKSCAKVQLPGRSGS